MFLNFVERECVAVNALTDKSVAEIKERKLWLKSQKQHYQPVIDTSVHQERVPLNRGEEDVEVERAPNREEEIVERRPTISDDAVKKRKILQSIVDHNANIGK